MAASNRCNDLMSGDDGLPVRRVRRWAVRKAHHVDRYCQMFAGIKKVRRRAYVELFSGPGRSWNADTGEYLDGSPLRALAADFTDYFFVDIDGAAANALEARIRRLTPEGKRWGVLSSDCNAAIDAIRAAVPAHALTLVFVDPTAFQIEMNSIQRLIHDRPAVDLIVTFHLAAMRRCRGLLAPALTAFFGSDAWPDALAEPHGQQGEALRRLYNEQLVPHGYLPDSYLDPVVVPNSVGREIYHLMLLSRSPLGRKFWLEAKKYDELGQRQMWC